MPQAGLSWQWPLVAGGAWAPHVLLGMHPGRGGPGCPRLRLSINQNLRLHLKGSAGTPGGRPTPPTSHWGAQWSGQVSYHMTWKGNVEASIQIDDTHVQGPGDFTFSPAVLVPAQTQYRILFTQTHQNVLVA